MKACYPELSCSSAKVDVAMISYGVRWCSNKGRVVFEAMSGHHVHFNKHSLCE